MFGITNGMSAEQAKAVRLSLVISVAYGLTSMTTSFTFKALLSSWNFGAPFFMLGLQMCASMALCLFLQSRPHLSALPGLEVPPRIDWNVARDGLRSGCLFVINIAVGLVGLQMVNVPMFLAIRRTGTAFSLAAEFFVLGKVASRETNMAVALIVLGAVVAGWDSLTRDGIGYLWTIANNMLTAAAVAYSKKFSDSHGLKGFGLPLYNALVALPLTFALSAAVGELHYASSYEFKAHPGFLAALGAASVLGVWTNYIHFLGGVHLGPLAMGIVGNVKDILATILGIILPFGGTPFVPTPKAILGLILSLGGAVLFSVAKLHEVRAAGGAAGGGAGAKGGLPASGSAPRLHGNGGSSGSGSEPSPRGSHLRPEDEDKEPLVGGAGESGFVAASSAFTPHAAPLPRGR